MTRRYVSTSRSLLLLDRSIYRALLTRGAFLIGLQDHHLYRDQEKCRLYVYVYIHTQTRLHVYTYILVDKEGSEIIIFIYIRIYVYKPSYLYTYIRIRQGGLRDYHLCRDQEKCYMCGYTCIYKHVNMYRRYVSI